MLQSPVGIHQMHRLQPEKNWRSKSYLTQYRKKKKSLASRVLRLHHNDPSNWSFCRRSCRLAAVLFRTARRNSTSSRACMALKLPKNSTRTWIINMRSKAALGINMYVRPKMASPSKRLCAKLQKMNRALHMFGSHSAYFRQVWYKIGSHVPAMQVCLATAGTRFSSSEHNPPAFEVGQSNVSLSSHIVVGTFGNVPSFFWHHSSMRVKPFAAFPKTHVNRRIPLLVLTVMAWAQLAGHSHSGGPSKRCALASFQWSVTWHMCTKHLGFAHWRFSVTATGTRQRIRRKIVVAKNVAIPSCLRRSPNSE